MNLLHLLPDEKFTPFTVDFCEKAFPGQNRFRIHSQNPDNPTFAAQTDNTRVQSGYYQDRTELLADTEWCNLVIIHGLSSVTAKLFDGIDVSAPLVWVGWGADYYNLLPDETLKFGLPASRALFSNHALVRQFPFLAENPITKLAKKALRGPTPPQWAQEFLPRIDFFSVIPIDWFGLEEVCPSFKAAHLDYFPYYTVEHSFAPGPRQMEGPDILVGNSATSANNHVETLKIVSDADTLGGRILVPLSYGRKHYADEIIKLGKNLFGDRFTPLVDFLPVEEYNNLIASCGRIVLGHQRGQAMGNLTAALYKGAKVFVRPENPYFQFYVDRGASLKSLSNERDLSEFNSEMPEEEKASNRKVVEDMWSLENAAKQARNIMETACTQYYGKTR